MKTYTISFKGNEDVRAEYPAEFPTFKSIDAAQAWIRENRKNHIPEALLDMDFTTAEIHAVRQTSDLREKTRIYIIDRHYTPTQHKLTIVER